MSMKDLAESNKKGKVSFGIREVLKLSKKKKLKKDARVFVAKDAREETFKALEKAEVEFEVLKTKAEISNELGLDFHSEVFLIN